MIVFKHFFHITQIINKIFHNLLKIIHVTINIHIIISLFSNQYKLLVYCII